MEAEISLTYKTAREAEAISKAVSPDNLKAPEGLHIKTLRRRNRVTTRIECRITLQTFNATIDDLLSAVQVAERSLLTVEKH